MGFDRWLLMSALLLLMLYPVACARPPEGMPRPGGMGRPEPEPVTEADYRIFDGEGNPSSLSAVVDAAADVSVVFLGEEHGNRVGHHLQLELFRQCHERYGAERPVVPAMEMFERDVQLVIDEYLGGYITERHFLRSARIWPGYRTDYRPAVEYAREHGLRVLASNAPRRHVNRVGRLGREALLELPAASRVFLPPLPYPEASEAYRARFRGFWEGVEAHAAESEDETSETAPDPEAEAEARAEFERFLSAQSLWDAAMAHTVAGALAKNPDALVVHFNGKFHSAAGLGIPEHLGQYRPGTDFLTFTISASSTFPEFDPELAGEGNFIAATNPERSRRAMGAHP
ncbi:MAG: ChaN family lipoprotein [Desulfococcaceae bacterium]